MPDFVLLDDQNLDCAIVLKDDAGNVVTGAAADAGSVAVAVTDPDGTADTADIVVTLAADGSSVNLKSTGVEGTGFTATPTGTLNGTALTGEPFVFDVNASPATTIGLVPGEPQHN